MLEDIIFIGECIGIIYFVLRITTMILAPKDMIFTSPKLGRIKARMKNGKIVRYYAHLKGLTGELPVKKIKEDDPDQTPYVGQVHINEETGEILTGKEFILSFWWIFFGVRFIGLDDIYQYEIDKVTVTPEGKVTREKVTASSLHFSGIYPVVIKDQETKEGVKGDLNYTITLQTTHAGESLKYKNWIDVVMPPVEATSKDYVSSTTVQGLITKKNEISTSPDSFVNCMKRLNDDRIGNISLHRKVGQRIIAASLIAVGFDDVIAKALEANKKAEAEGTAKVTQERLAADANVETTRGLKAKEDMITTVMKDRAATFAAKGGEQLAALERTREIASAIKGHSGTLVLGNSAIPTVPTGD